MYLSDYPTYGPVSGPVDDYQDACEILRNSIFILMDSQKKMMEIVGKLSDRISNIEKTILSASNSNSANSIVEEKSRIPPQLSVSYCIKIV